MQFQDNHIRNDAIRYQELAERWIKLKNLNISIADFFKTVGIFKVAVHEPNSFGELLIEELRNNGVEVAYIISRYCMNFRGNGVNTISEGELADRSDIKCIIVSQFEYYFETP